MDDIVHVKKKSNKTDYIQVRVTPEEKAKFDKLAVSRHTDISEIVRQLLHKESEQVSA